MDGGGRHAGELLEDDGTQQELERGSTTLDLKALMTASTDDSTQMRIDFAEVPKCFLPVSNCGHRFRNRRPRRDPDWETPVTENV